MLGLGVVVRRYDLLSSPELCRRRWRRTLLRMVLQLIYGAALKRVVYHILSCFSTNLTRSTLTCCTRW